VLSKNRLTKRIQHDLNHDGSALVQRSPTAACLRAFYNVSISNNKITGLSKSRIGSGLRPPLNAASGVAPARVPPPERRAERVRLAEDAHRASVPTPR